MTDTTESLARRVASFLAALPQVRESLPYSVTIGRQTFHGARYRESFAYLHDGRDSTGRTFKAGDRYMRESIFLVGALPAAYQRRAKTCFRLIGDSRDWYITCYATEETARDSRYAEYHPFGQTFIISPWDVPDGTAIDHYEPKPYTRVGATWSLES